MQNTLEVKKVKDVLFTLCYIYTTSRRFVAMSAYGLKFEQEYPGLATLNLECHISQCSLIQCTFILPAGILSVSLLHIKTVHCGLSMLLFITFSESLRNYQSVSEYNSIIQYPNTSNIVYIHCYDLPAEPLFFCCLLPVISI